MFVLFFKRVKRKKMCVCSYIECWDFVSHYNIRIRVVNYIFRSKLFYFDEMKLIFLNVL